MKNTQIINIIIERVANALGELNEKVIYVGGAIVSLYINDPAAEDVRHCRRWSRANYSYL